MRIATWNINSVRLRIGLVVRFLQDYQPDILCLQETKCPPGQFPTAALRQAGYGFIADNGYTGHHGVAIVSRRPFETTSSNLFCNRNDGRHICLRPAGSGFVIHSLYVPAGGDEPDPEINQKFAHKLQFLDEMSSWCQHLNGPDGLQHILAGDLNVAPLEHDVWSHKKLLKVVSHTPVETERLGLVMRAGRFHDPVRSQYPEPERLYSWWSYRARDWASADRGRRLDHIWVPQALAGQCGNARIVREARGWDKPSDHVPVVIDIDESV